MVKFIKAVSCPMCDTLIKEDGITADFTANEIDGIPVVDLSLFACESFRCPNCGTEVYIGDSDNLYEYEEPEENN